MRATKGFSHIQLARVETGKIFIKHRLDMTFNKMRNYTFTVKFMGSGFSIHLTICITHIRARKRGSWLGKHWTVLSMLQKMRSEIFVRRYVIL